MDSFDLPSTGKKLPGKHGQQELSAPLALPSLNNQATEKTKLSKLARLSL
jgi:hypothetical protein